MSGSTTKGGARAAPARNVIESAKRGSVDMDMKVPSNDPLYIANLHEQELKRLADLTTTEHTQVSRLMCGRFIRVGRDAFKITDVTLTKTGSIMLRGVQAFSRRRKPSIIGPLSVGEIVTEKVARLIINGRWGA